MDNVNTALSKKQITITITIGVVILIAILFLIGFIPRFYNTYIKNDSSQSQSSANSPNNSDNSNTPVSDNTNSPSDSSDTDKPSDKGDSSSYSDRLDCSKLSISTSGSINSSENYTDCTISISDCDSAYQIDDVSAGIRLRGNSTQRFSKKPYRIKFNEAIQPLGLSTGDSKSWVLLAEYSDTSMLRNTLTFNFANRLSGIDFAPDCAYVELYINDEYNGLYLLTEQVQVNNDRVDIDESGVQDSSITDTGYLLELEASSDRRYDEGSEGSDWFEVTGYAGGNSNNNFFNNFDAEHSDSYDVAYYVIKSDAKSSSQVRYIQDYMIQVYDAIYKDKDETSIKDLVDIDSAVDMYILQLLCCDYDNNFSSSYVYKDAGGKLFFGVPWDFDLAYGNYSGHSSYSENYMFHLLAAFGEFDWFNTLVKERFSELNNGSDSPIQNMITSIDTYCTSLSDKYSTNFNYNPSSSSSNDNSNFWRGNGGFNQNGGGGGGFNHGTSYSSQKDAADALKSWLNNRINWINNRYN